MKALFIDTYYDESSPKENEKFQQYTQELLEFANSVEPFECKDIKTALTELMEAQKNINDLKNDLENANNQLQEANDQLENSNVCLFWSFCFNPPQIGSFGTGCRPFQPHIFPIQLSTPDFSTITFKK